MPWERCQLQLRILDSLECGHLGKYSIANGKGKGKYKHRMLRFIQSSIHSKKLCAHCVSDLVLGMGNVMEDAEER